ncbi:MAG: cobalt-precorrin-5B (C(1))-methyltransferase [Spirochaetia bacterium]|nr:cobalt-precorrin-5B (C(1))-methyltransferase [Spirochaetia bacterium]
MSREKKQDLKTGYTTGTCAAAAAKAAIWALVEKKPVDEVSVSLPIGKTAVLRVSQTAILPECAVSDIIKDGGDDPDVTHGAVIRAEVSWMGAGDIDQDAIKIFGGTGVGKVTRPGLPVAVGEAAINPTPRKMIEHEIRETLKAKNIRRAVKVIISVPDGEKIALQTMNARLGILGGISILGTRGIVIPFSTAAYRSTLAVSIKASAENHLDHLVLTTGGRSEKYGMAMYPNLDPMAFHEAGEFIGFALKKCVSYGIKKATIAGMMGKFSKVAAGELMLHSSKSSVDFDFLASLAKEAGADADTVEQIQSANTASQAGDIMKEKGMMRFFDLVTTRCWEVCSKKTAGQVNLEVILYTINGELLSRKEFI